MSTPPIHNEQQVGERLRERRKVRGLSLKNMAERSGVSIGMISQVERGLSSPSLRTLSRICEALEMPVHWLFESNEGPDAPQAPVIRLGSHRTVSYPTHAFSETILTPDSFSDLQLLEIRVEPNGHSGDAYQHRGIEAGFVIEGTFGLEVDGEHYVLVPGDSFYFDSQRAHRYWSLGEETVRVIWAVTPAYY